MTTVEDAWGIINHPEGPPCDGRVPQVEALTSEYHLSYDQRRNAQAKQDAVCGTVESNVALPTWPPKAPVDRPLASRGASKAATHAPQAAMHAATHAPQAAMHVAGEETVRERCQRCTLGIMYDLQNWRHVSPPPDQNKMVYILRKHDRTPVSVCLGLILLLVVVLTVTAFSPSKRVSQSN